jgi:leucyl-tRNA synthetase
VGSLEAAFTEDGVVVDSGPASGLSSSKTRKLLSELAEKDGFGKGVVNYHLRDWGFSRQRYWGTPIPIVYCERCGTPEEPKAVPVPVEDLPVLLPEKAVITGSGEPPLAKVPEFMAAKCPSCGGPARREAETMDTFVDSAWYFARFLSPKDDARPFEPEAAKRWLPIDIYVGGPEHAVLHLLYFRFWTKVMQELGLCQVREPARRLITQGIVLGPDNEKMSKSRGNVVSPRAYIDRFGADTTRLFVLFAGPVERDFAWNDAQVEGLHRFLTRVWRLFHRFHGEVAKAGKPDPASSGRALELRRAAHRTLKRVTEDLERIHFNTAVAALMEHVNAISALVGGDDAKTLESDAERAALREALEVLAVGLSPFAPHFAEEVWAELGHDRCLQESSWPPFDAALVKTDAVAYVVQVNGKLRGQVETSTEAGEAEVVALARADAKVAPHLAGKTVRKVVFVPKRLVNFVVG